VEKEIGRRGRSSSSASLGGGVEERRRSREWCGLERCSGVHFIGGEGRGGGAAEAVGWHTGGPPLMSRWISVGHQAGVLGRGGDRAAPVECVVH
jgi:hypothetical protein